MTKEYLARILNSKTEYAFSQEQFDKLYCPEYVQFDVTEPAKLAIADPVKLGFAYKRGKIDCAGIYLEYEDANFECRVKVMLNFDFVMFWPKQHGLCKRMSSSEVRDQNQLEKLYKRRLRQFYPNQSK